MMVVSRLNSQALSGKSIKTGFFFFGGGGGGGAKVFSIVKPQNCELTGFTGKMAFRYVKVLFQVLRIRSFLKYVRALLRGNCNFQPF